MAAEFTERVGARIRERREELQLTRAEVARRMAGRVNENQVYRWEKGQHQPQPDTMEELARVLNVDVSYFMVPEPKPRTGGAGASLMDVLSPDASQLDRIEAKLDRLLSLLDHEEPGSATAAQVLVQGVEASAQAVRGQRRSKGSKAADA